MSKRSCSSTPSSSWVCWRFLGKLFSERRALAQIETELTGGARPAQCGHFGEVDPGPRHESAARAEGGPGIESHSKAGDPRQEAVSECVHYIYIYICTEDLYVLFDGGPLSCQLFKGILRIIWILGASLLLRSPRGFSNFWEALKFLNILITLKIRGKYNLPGSGRAFIKSFIQSLKS